MKKVRRRSGKSGLPPGSLVSVGDRSIARASIGLFVYNADEVRELALADLSQMQAVDPARHSIWLDIDGLGDDTVINKVGERFGLHPLLLEDVLNTDHRPKVEEYSDTLFVVAKMLSLDEETGGIQSEQISLVLGTGFVITFQERPGDVLDPIRERLRNNTGRVRRMSPAYLMYSLLDVLVDNYFLIVEDVGRRIEELERKIGVKPGGEDLHSMQEIRSLLITVNRYTTPTREMAGRMNTLQNELIDKPTRRYINDLQDHTVYIADSINTFRDLLASLENTYHAGVNLRMGQVIKLLTIISTIFIPLTFVVGVYGMNFDNMPELRWKYGYFLVLGAMAAVAAIMLLWFRRRKWL